MIPPKHPDCRVAGGEPVAGDVHVDGRYIAGHGRGARAALKAAARADSAVACPTIKWAKFRGSRIQSRTDPYFPPPSLRIAAFRCNAQSSFQKWPFSGNRDRRVYFGAAIVPRLIVPAVALAAFQVERSRKKPEIIGHFPD